MPLPTLPNQVPITPLIPNRWLAKCSTALTDKTGATTTGMVALGTAGTAGGILQDIRIKGTATTAAGSLLLFLLRSTVYYLVDEILVTIDTSDAIGDLSFDSGKLVRNDNLQPGDELFIATTQAQTLVVSANEGDF